MTSFFFLFSQLADLPLELPAGLFFSLSAATQTPNRRCQSFFFFSSPLLSVFLLLHSLLSSKTHRRTKHHQPAPTVSAGPQMCTKTTRASEKRMEICCYISALFSEEKSEGEREGEVWDSSCSFPRLTPPFGLLPSLLTASFFKILHPLFCFVSPSSS